MASWALACKNCRAVFAYSQISDTLADHYLPTRPAFPPSGVERECPNCKSKFTYQGSDLTFQSDRNSRIRRA
jgi:hypothetical protein